MNWRVKVVGFKVLSSVPGGKAFYRFTQKHLTGSLRATEARVSQKLDVGLRYVDWMNRHGLGDKLVRGGHLDFGAGWHPSIPLLYYSLGVEHQYLFDVTPLLDDKLVKETLDIFLTIVQNLSWPYRTQLRRLPPEMGNRRWREYLEGLGMKYQAPYNGAFTSLGEGLDVVTSTQVLLHIPRPVLANCFGQIYSGLCHGGLFLATIHLRDLLTAAQPGISKYNQLRYSNETWERWINSGLMSYNRLRAPDYRELLEKAGFELLCFEIEQGAPADFAELDRIPIAECFQRYSRDDLAAKHLFFCARKR
jgi:hypothetical protein